MLIADAIKIAHKAAHADLDSARRYGLHMIGGTTKGTIQVTHADGVYVVVRCPNVTSGAIGPETLATGAAAVVIPVLAALYLVEPA